MGWLPLLVSYIGCLTTNQQIQAMGMLDAGMSVRRVAQTFNVR